MSCSSHRCKRSTAEPFSCAIADTARPEAARTLACLKRLGLEAVVMLTGDNERTAHRIAAELGVDRVYAQLLPEDKVKVIEQLQR